MSIQRREPAMRKVNQQICLSVYCRNTDKWKWVFTSYLLMMEAHRSGLAGATMLRGLIGVDSEGKMLEPTGWRIQPECPLVIEFIDRPDVIGVFLPKVKDIAPESLITLKLVDVAIHKRREEDLFESMLHPNGIYPRIEPRFDAVSEVRAVPSSGKMGQSLRVFLDETDMIESEHAYRAIIKRARALGLCWAVAIRADVGFGLSGTINYQSLQPFSRKHSSIVVEIIDSKDVERLLPYLSKMTGQTTATLEYVWVLKHQAVETIEANLDL